MGYKKLRKKYKIRSPYIGRWLKWLKLKTKGQTWLILCLLMACLVGGCVRVILPDGTEYLRIGSQQIGEALLTLPDGSELLLDGQKSELPKVEITATSITIGGKKVGQ